MNAIRVHRALRAVLVVAVGTSFAIGSASAQDGRVRRSIDGPLTRQLIVEALVTAPEVSLAVSVGFDSNSATLTAAARRDIEEIAVALDDPRLSGVQLTVEGHTDAVGAADYNLRLSQRRADAVVSDLVQRGVAAARLRAVGFGESRPLRDYPPDDGRQRRVEFVRFDRHPVEVTAYVTEGSRNHVEAEVRGPFFSAGESEPVVIRAFPKGEPFERREWWTQDADDARRAVFGSDPASRAAFQGYLEFRRDDTLLHLFDVGYTNELVGACLSSGSGRLEILMAPWEGGASTPAGLVGLYYDESSRTIEMRGFPTAVIEAGAETTAVTCSGDEALWGDEFLPCSCDKLDYWLAAEAQMAALEDLVRVGEEPAQEALRAAGFDGAAGEFAAAQAGFSPILDEDFSRVLRDISRLAETEAAWARTAGGGMYGDLGLSIDRFESPAFVFVAVTLDTVSYYGSRVLFFARASEERFWRPVYAADWPEVIDVEVHGFVDDETVSLSLCVDDYDCEWTGFEIVELNLRTLWGRVMR